MYGTVKQDDESTKSGHPTPPLTTYQAASQDSHFLSSVLVLEKDRVHFPVCVSVCLCDRVSNEKKRREQVGVRDQNFYLFFSLHEETKLSVRYQAMCFSPVKPVLTGTEQVYKRLLSLCQCSRPANLDGVARG